MAVKIVFHNRESFGKLQTGGRGPGGGSGVRDAAADAGKGDKGSRHKPEGGA